MRGPAGALSAPRPPVLAAFAVVAACLPIVVAAVRAVTGDWLALDDNALFVIRGRDVLTGHHPLLGTSTSASVALGELMNNPGPLLFDLYALPARVAGDAGLAVGVAAVNVLSVVGMAVLAWRLGRGGLVAVAMVPAAALGWAMGSELLHDPWQPHSLLFPFLLLLVAAWAVAAGDAVALPVLAAVGSLLLQTYVVYGYLVPLVTAAAVGAAAFGWRRGGDDRPDARRLARAGAATALVLALCWFQPVIEQLTGDGKGNLGRIAGAVGDGDSLGLDTGARLVAAVVAVPPWWSRATFTDAFLLPSGTLPGDTTALQRVPSTPVALAWLAAVAAALVAGAVAARRRHDRVAGGLLVVVGAGLVGAVLTSRSMPLGLFGVSPHTLRWLWPIALVTSLAVVVAVVGSERATRPRAAAAWGVAVAGFAALALPAAAGPNGPALASDAIPVARRLHEQLDAVEGRGELLFDGSTLEFGSPFGTTLLAELQRRDVPWAVDDPVLVRQFGPARAADGDEALRIFVLTGDRASTPIAGAERVAVASALDDGDQAELDRLRDVIGARRVGLSAAGQATLATEAFDLPAEPDGGYDVRALRESGALWTMLDGRLLDLDDADARRWAALELVDHRRTVAVYVEPLAAGAP